MRECIPHPDDPSRWLPVDEAWERVWRDHGVAFALIEAHDKRHAGTDQSVAALWAAIKAQDAAHVDDMRALGGLVAELSTRLGETVDALAEQGVWLTEQGVWLTELEARVKALEPLPSGPAFGIDVSKYQTVEQIRSALAGKPDFCIVNATTGLRTISPSLAANTAESRQWADLTGFYHWAQTVNESATTPDKSDPIGEAKHFNANSGAQVGDLICLDNEEALGTWAQRVAYDIAWLEFQAETRGATPLNYKNWDWIKNIRAAATVEQWTRWSAFPIWLADYSGVPGQHATISPKAGTNISPRILVHQYSTADNLDRNWTPDIAALRACAVTLP